MLRYIFKRILLLIPVMIAVSFIVFALMDLAPGDAMTGWDLSELTMEEIAEIREEMGLDDPLIVRYGRYMFGLLQGDLGVGEFSGISVWYSFITRLPATLVLAAGSIFVGVVFSIPLGIFAAKRVGKTADSLTTGFTMVGMSMPGFWQGVLMILLFSYVLGWFPAAGNRHGLGSLVLPAITAGSTLMATCARQTRSSMLEVLKADYLRTARAKGVPEKAVINKHALGNALIPIVTTVGMSAAFAVSGTAVIETVFSWPGVGRLIVEAVAARDVTATTGLVILTTILYVLVLLIVDIAYAFIDPRIKAQYVNKGKKKKKVTSGKAATPKHQPAAPLVEADAGIAAIAMIADERNGSDFSEPDEAATVQTDRFEPEQHLPTGGYAENNMAVEAENTSSDNASVADADAAQKQNAGIRANEKTAESRELVSHKYRKRSRFGEVLHNMRRNKGAVAGLVILAAVVVLFAVSLFIPFESVVTPSIPDRFSPPSLRFPFGTDNMGRCQFTRVIYATRFSLPIGLGATILGALIGILLGSIAAYYDGTIKDEAIMRFSDALASIPGILMGMVIITTLGRSVPNIIVAIGIANVPMFIRIARASVLTVTGNEYVEAARAIGLSNIRILYTQILPNGLAPIIITFTTSLGMSILISASLSFLGFGVPVPNPEWGALISAGRDTIRHAPWLTAFPGIFIMVTVMAFNLLGDGLRDAFDPKMKK